MAKTNDKIVIDISSDHESEHESDDESLREPSPRPPTYVFVCI